VSGTCAQLFKSEVQFGHAGARSGGVGESAQAKNEALKSAGAVVPGSFEGLEEVIRCDGKGLGEVRDVHVMRTTNAWLCCVRSPCFASVMVLVFFSPEGGVFLFRHLVGVASGSDFGQ